MERTSGSAVAGADRPTGFRLAQEAFQRALEIDGHPVRESFYRFAGREVRVRVVGLDLAGDLARAFAHLQEPVCQSPRLTIDLWDEAETGVAYPDDDAPDDVDIRSKAGDGIVTGFARSAVFRYQLPGAVTWLDRRASHIVGWRRSARSSSIPQRSKPFPVLLAIWYFDQEVHVVHAGLVAKHARGVLIGGASGSGKSTTALACAFDGFDYLGDDHVGLSQAGGEFVGHSLYNGARLAPHLGERFPAATPYALDSDNPKDPKRLVLLSGVPGVAVARQTPVRAIALPRVVGTGPTCLRRASKREALLRLAPTSVFTPFGPGARGFRRLGDLVEAVPAYWLDLGADVAEIPAVVEQML